MRLTYLEMIDIFEKRSQSPESKDQAESLKRCSSNHKGKPIQDNISLWHCQNQCEDNEPANRPNYLLPLGQS